MRSDSSRRLESAEDLRCKLYRSASVLSKPRIFNSTETFARESRLISQPSLPKLPFVIRAVNRLNTGWFWNNATYLYHRDQCEKLSLDHLVPKIFQQVFRTCFRHREIYSVAPAQASTADRRAAAAAGKSRGMPLLRSFLTVAGRGKAGETRENWQTVDDRLARKTFVRSTNFSWLAYCWLNNECFITLISLMLSMIKLNQVLRYTRVIIDFFISRITADVTVLQHYVKTYRAGVIFSFYQWTHVVPNISPF